MNWLNSFIIKNSPWESGGSGPKVTKGDFAELFKKGEGQFKKMMFKNSPENNSKFIFLFPVLVLVIWLLSGFYVIDEGEQAVVLRFGKYRNTTHTGLNYHFPEPIEKIMIEKVEMIRKEEIGFRAQSPSFGGSSMSGRAASMNLKTIPHESHVLTRDENILDINYVVQWRISDLKDYIFNVSNARETVRNVSESALREIVGNNKMVTTFTEGRSAVEQEARILAQKTLDLYKSGVEITTFQMQKVDPPLEVIDAFRDVQTAKADKEREINQAQAYSNDIIPRAVGQAAKIEQEGEGYKKEVVEKAIGDASRFNAVYEQYAKTKNVTRTRLYFDTMEEVLSGADKIIVDSSHGASGIVPYLPLPEFNKKKVE